IHLAISFAHLVEPAKLLGEFPGDQAAPARMKLFPVEFEATDLAGALVFDPIGNGFSLGYFGLFDAHRVLHVGLPVPACKFYFGLRQV
ncbi:MAG TPA: hypothetical protein PKA91_19095, partial [Leptospiraceae bacterium]|nr:hypothetical protein [Leptospiraceae bacterium]